MIGFTRDATCTALDSLMCWPPYQYAAALLSWNPYIGIGVLCCRYVSLPPPFMLSLRRWTNRTDVRRRRDEFFFLAGKFRSFVIPNHNFNWITFLVTQINDNISVHNPQCDKMCQITRAAVYTCFCAGNCSLKPVDRADKLMCRKDGITNVLSSFFVHKRKVSGLRKRVVKSKRKEHSNTNTMTTKWKWSFYTVPTT